MQNFCHTHETHNENKFLIYIRTRTIRCKCKVYNNKLNYRLIK